MDGNEKCSITLCNGLWLHCCTAELKKNGLMLSHSGRMMEGNAKNTRVPVTFARLDLHEYIQDFNPNPYPRVKCMLRNPELLKLKWSALCLRDS